MRNHSYLSLPYIGFAITKFGLFWIGFSIVRFFINIKNAKKALLCNFHVIINSLIRLEQIYVAENSIQHNYSFERLKLNRISVEYDIIKKLNEELSVYNEKEMIESIIICWIGWANVFSVKVRGINHRKIVYYYRPNNLSTKIYCLHGLKQIDSNWYVHII